MAVAIRTSRFSDLELFMSQAVSLRRRKTKSTAATERSRRRMSFKFSVNDNVLVHWKEDKKIYYAKIKKIDERRQVCLVQFDDGSREEASFSAIHGGELTQLPVVFCLSYNIRFSNIRSLAGSASLLVG